MAISLLLADDSPTIAKILTLALAQDGYTIKSVLTAAEADIELAKSPAPSLFLVDISLPDKDAFRFARELRAKTETLDIKIIFLANSFEPVDESRCQLVGADAVIMKPFDPTELRRKLKEVLEKPINLGGPKETTKKIVLEPPKASPPIRAPISEAPAPTPKLSASPTEPKRETADLSPKAQELSDFFAAEVESASRVNLRKPEPEPAPIDDIVDLSSAVEDWSPIPAISAEPAKDTLSQWTTKTKASNPLFDTANASFRFSPDYVKRISRAFEHSDSVEHDLSGAEQFNPEKQNFGAEADVRAVEELHRLLEAKNKIKVEALSQKLTPSSVGLVQPQSVAPTNLQSTPKPASPLSRAELEEIVRDEVRLACKNIVEKISWEVIPELAENIIRKELDKVLKELDS